VHFVFLQAQTCNVHSVHLNFGSAVCVKHAGGGYVLGSCSQQLSTVAAATAAAANLTIICPEYGLAPEHPFPAGLSDAVSVHKDLLRS
jgi:acetyl esterase/lipase